VVIKKKYVFFFFLNRQWQYWFFKSVASIGQGETEGGLGTRQMGCTATANDTIVSYKPVSAFNEATFCQNQLIYHHISFQRLFFFVFFVLLMATVLSSRLLNLRGIGKNICLLHIEQLSLTQRELNNTKKLYWFPLLATKFINN
jgi:hypothetical protein